MEALQLVCNDEEFFERVSGAYQKQHQKPKEEVIDKNTGEEKADGQNDEQPLNVDFGVINKSTCFACGNADDDGLM